MSYQPSGGAPPAYNVEPQQPGDVMMQQAQPVKPGDAQPQSQHNPQYQPAVQGQPQQQYQPAGAPGQPHQQYQQQPMMHQPVQNQQVLMQPAPAPGQVVYSNTRLQRTPLANIQCPNCKQVVNTSVEFESGPQTWMASAGICLLGLWCGCCLIPFSSTECQHALHKCTNCGYIIGEGRGPFF